MNRNLILTGDWHIQDDTPNSRIDNYKQTLVDKTDQLLNLCLQNNADLVIPGDIFSKIQTNNEFIIYFMKLFKKFKDNDINVISIFGNHDVYRTQYQLEEKTPLKILEESNLIKILRNGESLEYNNTIIYGWGYYDEIKEVPKIENKRNFGIIHKFYSQPSYREYNFNQDDLQAIGLQYALLGHDHISYEVEKKPCIVFRPGALTRGTSHWYNFTRGVFVYLFNTETFNYSEISLRIRPYLEVAREQKVIEAMEKQDKTFKEYTKKMEDIVVSEGSKIKELVDRIKDTDGFSENSKNILISKIVS